MPSMGKSMLAKRLGRSLREAVPGITWKCLPERMLRLLIEISEAESRRDDARRDEEAGRDDEGRRRR